MRNLYLIATTTFKRTIRNKVLYCLIALSLFLVLLSSTYQAIMMENEIRLMRNGGLFLITIVGVLIAAFVGSSELPYEIKNGTVQTMLTKGINRWEFVLGKFLGTYLMAVINLAILAAGVMLIVMFKEKTDLDWGFCLAGGLAMCELAVLLAFAILLSTFLHEALSAIFTLGLFFVGHEGQWLYVQANEAASPVAAYAAKVVYYVIPDLLRMNLHTEISNKMDMPAEVPWLGAVYGAAYTVFLLCLAVAIFRRREF